MQRDKGAPLCSWPFQRLKRRPPLKSCCNSGSLPPNRFTVTHGRSGSRDGNRCRQALLKQIEKYPLSSFSQPPTSTVLRGITAPDLAGVETCQHSLVGNERPKGLHQIQRKGRAAASRLMVDTQSRIEPNCSERANAFSIQYRVRVGKYGVYRILWRMPCTDIEMYIPSTLSEDIWPRGEIERRGASFDAQQTAQRCGALRLFREHSESSQAFFPVQAGAAAHDTTHIDDLG